MSTHNKFAVVTVASSGIGDHEYDILICAEDAGLERAVDELIF